MISRAVKNLITLIKVHEWEALVLELYLLFQFVNSKRNMILGIWHDLQYFDNKTRD